MDEDGGGGKGYFLASGSCLFGVLCAHRVREIYCDMLDFLSRCDDGEGLPSLLIRRLTVPAFDS